MNWFDLLVVQGALKSLLQHHSLKASILQHSAFFPVQLYPLQYSWTALVAQLVKNPPAVRECDLPRGTNPAGSTPYALPREGLNLSLALPVVTLLSSIKLSVPVSAVNFLFRTQKGVTLPQKQVSRGGVGDSAKALPATAASFACHSAGY